MVKLSITSTDLKFIAFRYYITINNSIGNKFPCMSNRIMLYTTKLDKIILFICIMQNFFNAVLFYLLKLSLALAHEYFHCLFQLHLEAR